MYYSYSTTLKNDTKFPILQTIDNATINGTFAEKASAVSGKSVNLTLDYTTPDVVYAVYLFRNNICKSLLYIIII